MDARKVRSRKALQEALLDLLEEKPLSAVSVRELTERAGVGYATFFRHYPTLEDLLRAIAEDAVGPLLERGLPLLFGDDRRQAARDLVRHVGENRKLWSLLLNQVGGAVLREQFGSAARKLAESRPPARSGAPLELRVHFAVRGAVDILAWWLMRRPDISEADVVRYLDQLVIRPIEA
ncbi:TetR/AcrR family transcriptional regulator [Novosphingobium sp. TH158]|uniref:TetR/AcrR family transcriptional regulator n=1 Tax=Novosphingobium sp. TH158 TaxID=2067455 RepID=UPI000C797932|nr:helix-turn-helix domain-containing protein [Novosphingobium sp. TH158]PLK27519.1 TetR/AcrR family transcriptional regulator [Novosphingobium sp. TH158]